MARKETLRRKRLLCFDMDGVLIDSEAAHGKIEQEMCRRHGIPIPLSEWGNFSGKTNLSIFTYIVEKFGDKRFDPQALVEEKRKIFLERVSDLKPIPGAVEFLKMVWNKSPFLAMRRIPLLALATSSGRAVQEAVCAHLGIGHCFNTIVTGSDVMRGKPHPDIYIVAMARLGVHPSECAVIEDSVSGVRAARAAGCYTIGITTSFSVEALLKAGADQVIASFDELKF